MTREEVAALDGPPAYSRPCSSNLEDAKDIDLEEGKRLLEDEDAGASLSSPTDADPVPKRLPWHTILILFSSACISLILLALYVYKGMQPGMDPANQLALAVSAIAPICTILHHVLVIVGTNLPPSSALYKHMYRSASYRVLALCIVMWLAVPLVLVYTNATTDPQDEDITYIALLSLMESIACFIAYAAYEQEGVKQRRREPMPRQRIVS